MGERHKSAARVPLESRERALSAIRAPPESHTSDKSATTADMARSGSQNPREPLGQQSSTPKIFRAMISESMYRHCPLHPVSEGSTKWRQDKGSEKACVP